MRLLPRFDRSDLLILLGVGTSACAVAAMTRWEMGVLVLGIAIIAEGILLGLAPRG